MLPVDETYLPIRSALTRSNIKIDENQYPADDLMIVGGDDFLAEQGVDDTDEFRVKTHLCHEIASLVEARDLSQTVAAKIVGLEQSDVSRIVNYRHETYSTWRLMKALSALGADIVINVQPTSGYDNGVIMSRNVLDRESDEVSPVQETQPEPDVSYGMRT